MRARFVIAVRARDFMGRIRMIDINLIRTQTDLFRTAVKRKRIDIDLDQLLQWDIVRRDLQFQVEALRKERNTLSEAIKDARDDERAKLIKESHGVALELRLLGPKLRLANEQFAEMMLMVPSLPADGVPDGGSDHDNVEVRRWGAPPAFDFEPKDHLEIARLRKLALFDEAHEIAGSRAYALIGDGALLELAILRFALDFVIGRGFSPVLPPLLVNEEAMTGTGYFPIGKENAYSLERDKLFLVGTSEVGLVALHRGQTLRAQDLPLRYAGLSTCFRREAGAAGKDTRGFYRVHQFQKVEQVVIMTGDQVLVAEEHEQLLQNAEQILQALDLPYRVVFVCAGELGLGQVKKHDIETWMPSRNAYGETHSCSTLADFQARRLQIRYEGQGQEKLYAHTLNNTAIASPRILIAFLENHQNADGSINIPAPLRPYLGGRSFL
jgi:seryl-tRNA synthetase